MRLFLINPSNPLVSMVKVKESRWKRYRLWKPLSLMVLAGLTPREWAVLAGDVAGQLGSRRNRSGGHLLATQDNHQPRTQPFTKFEKPLEGGSEGRLSWVHENVFPSIAERMGREMGSSTFSQANWMTSAIAPLGTRVDMTCACHMQHQQEKCPCHRVSHQ